MKVLNNALVQVVCKNVLMDIALRNKTTVQMLWLVLYKHHFDVLVINNVVLPSMIVLQ